MVLSLSAKGLTSGEIVAHLAEVYGTSTSKATVSASTDKDLGAIAEWRTRRPDAVYPVVSVDAIHTKIRDGQVGNQPVYLVLSVTCNGYREILSSRLSSVRLA